MATIGTVTRKTPVRSSRVVSRLKALGALFLMAVMVWDLLFTIAFYRRPLWVIDETLHVRLSMAGIHSEFVKVGPYRVHYFVGGKGQPLLLIHGLGSRSEDWTPEMPDYAKKGFRVYAIDLLGCGRTDHPDIAYTIQEQVELVQGFMEALHLQKTDVIGWSMGGWIALKFATEHPENVRRLVVMDSAGLSFKTGLTPQVFEPRTIPQLQQLEELLVPHPHQLPDFFNHALLRAMEKNFRVVHRTVASMLTGKDLLDGHLRQLEVPVLIQWGEQDTLIPESVAFRMHQAIRQSVLELYSGCGHIGPATCASRMVPRVIDFLDSKPPAAGGVAHF